MPQTPKIDVAVIGLGHFSAEHLSAWAALPDVALAGVTDPDPACRNRAQETYGVQTFPDAEALIAATDPRIVDIVAPASAQADLIRQALAPGRIIICQKPFCASLDEAAAVTAEAEDTGAILVVHENVRFQPWHRTIREFLMRGRMGHVWSARFDLRPGDGRGANAYLDRQPALRTLPHFLVRETAIHQIDLFRWLFGPVTHVYADLRRLNPAIRGEDAGILILDHSGGTRSLFDGNRLADHVSDDPRRTMGEMEVVGEGGTLRLNGAGHVTFRPFGSDAWEEVPLTAPPAEGRFGGGCAAALIAHVVKNADRPELIETRARDYLPVLATVAAAYRSAETGQREVPVTPPGRRG